MKYKGWLNLDHCEYQYVKALKGKELIAWTDEEAIERYPNLAWVYDKYEACKELCNGKVWDLEKEDPPKSEFPVIIKPRKNLLGMGIGAYKAENRFKIKDRKGKIAQRFYLGKHITTDYAVCDGNIIDSFSFLADKDSNGSFTLFKSTPRLSNSNYKIARTLAKKLKNGFINIESINDNIIEVHLRPSVQFFDISADLIENGLERIKTGLVSATYFEKTYSRVIRIPKSSIKDCTPAHKGELVLPTGVRSVQFTWEPDKTLDQIPQDEFSYRVLVVNGDNLKEVDKFAKKVYSEIRFE